MSLARLTALAAVAEATCDAELAALARLTRQIGALRKKIETLRSGHPPAADAYPVAEALWARGRTIRLRRSTSELAALMVQRDMQIARSRRAFGRSEAASALLRRARSEDAGKRRRADGSGS